MDMTFLRASFLAMLFFLTACNDPAPVAKTDAPAATVLEGKTMGTFWRVSVMNLDKTRTDELRGKIQAQLDADDQLLSTYKNDSALMRFNLSTSTSLWPVSEAMAASEPPKAIPLSLMLGASGAVMLKPASSQRSSRACMARTNGTWRLR